MTIVVMHETYTNTLAKKGMLLNTDCLIRKSAAFGGCAQRSDAMLAASDDYTRNPLR